MYESQRAYSEISLQGKVHREGRGGDKSKIGETIGKYVCMDNDCVRRATELSVEESKNLLLL